eukprot:TRINITY_DN23037_c0_g1_i2.p1 TRINITY_DN23037_c0_g1~~TRINITY_DN23037_c0_g1_i2.p1  ORF type:complete len:434 (+),score=47.75 TRINITY_DN23037_c0_g1_i2:151-1452(+)
MLRFLATLDIVGRAAATWCRDMEAAAQAAHPARRHAWQLLDELGDDLCEELRRTAGSIDQVTIADRSFGGLPALEGARSQGTKGDASSLLLTSPSELCEQCIPLRRCLNALSLLALALVLLDAGASKVHYERRRSSEEGRNEATAKLIAAGLQPCGSFGDWRDGVDSLIVAVGAEAVLLELLTPESADVQCSKCSRARHLGQLPSATLDREHSDKGRLGHYYTRLYDHVLPPRCCAIHSLLEVGIGSVDASLPSSMKKSVVADDGHYRPGASLRAWRDVFPLANVTGLDIDRAAMFRAARTRTLVANTLNSTRISEALQNENFDVIIDDGLHTPLGQWATLRSLWRLLRIGGLYIIEDVGRSSGTGAMASMMGAIVVNTGSTHDVTVAKKLSEAMPIGLVGKGDRFSAVVHEALNLLCRLAAVNDHGFGGYCS